MNARAAIVGGFILGALALVVAGIVFFGGRHLFTPSTRVVVFFSESVAGLDIGAPVTFHGVHIGSVQNIVLHFSPNTMTAQIPVYLEVTTSQLIVEGKKFEPSAANTERLVAVGLRAQLALQSFVTGQLRVDLDFRPGTPAPLVGMITDIAEIPSVPSDLSQLRNQLSQLPLRELAETAQQAFASLRRLSDHLDSVVDPLAKSGTRTADAITQAMQTTDEAVRQVRADASTALHDLDSLLVDARAQLGARGGELSQALTEADRTVRRAETLLDSLNTMVQTRSQFRDDLEATVRDLAATASSLRRFAATIEQNPNVLLTGRPSR
jgi:paraquat-inducible protein B